MFFPGVAPSASARASRFFRPPFVLGAANEAAIARSFRATFRRKRLGTAALAFPARVSPSRDKTETLRYLSQSFDNRVGVARAAHKNLISPGSASLRRRAASAKTPTTWIPVHLEVGSCDQASRERGAPFVQESQFRQQNEL